mgnify:CR=1 FL=1
MRGRDDAHRIARDFVRLPFNHLFFTGSTAVGKKYVMAITGIAWMSLARWGASTCGLCGSITVASTGAPKMASG